jgi:hypothetical protein
MVAQLESKSPSITWLRGNDIDFENFEAHLYHFLLLELADLARGYPQTTTIPNTSRTGSRLGLSSLVNQGNRTG